MSPEREEFVTTPLLALPSTFEELLSGRKFLATLFQKSKRKKRVLLAE